MAADCTVTERLRKKCKKKITWQKSEKTVLSSTFFSRQAKTLMLATKYQINISLKKILLTLFDQNRLNTITALIKSQMKAFRL